MNGEDSPHRLSGRGLASRMGRRVPMDMDAAANAPKEARQPGSPRQNAPVGDMPKARPGNPGMNGRGGFSSMMRGMRGAGARVPAWKWSGGGQERGGRQ